MFASPLKERMRALASVENKLPLLNLEKLNNDPDKELVLFELPKNV